MELSEQDKAQLAQMVSQSNAENYTKEIRDAKNSVKIIQKVKLKVKQKKMKIKNYLKILILQ